MKKFTLVLAVICILALATGVMSADMYFVQDDFVLQFGTPGNAGSAGGSFTATGYIKDWSVDSNIAWFEMTGGNPLGAQLVGTQYITDYISTLTLYTGPKGNTSLSNLVWQGNGSFNTIVNQNGSTFSLPGVRPGYETQPGAFRSIGSGSFAQTTTSAMFSNNAFFLGWMGSYNWGYDNSVGGGFGPNTTYQSGNIQGMLSPTVPEPMSMALGLMGLGTMAGYAKLRRRRS